MCVDFYNAHCMHGKNDFAKVLKNLAKYRSEIDFIRLKTIIVGRLS